MSKTQVYVDAVRTILGQNAGGPIRCKDLFDQAKAQGLLPDVKYAYHYTLKAAKTSAEFDTSKRGWVSLAVAGAVQEPVVEQEFEAADFAAADEQVV